MSSLLVTAMAVATAASEDDGDDKDCTPGVFESVIISCSWLSDGGKEMDGGCGGKTSSEEDIGRRGDRMGVFTGVQLIDLEGGGDRCPLSGECCRLGSMLECINEEVPVLLVLLLRKLSEPSTREAIDVGTCARVPVESLLLSDDDAPLELIAVDDADKICTGKVAIDVTVLVAEPAVMTTGGSTVIELD